MLAVIFVPVTMLNDDETSDESPAVFVATPRTVKIVPGVASDGMANVASY